MINNLIFDRTQDDLERLKELKSKILTEGLDSLTDDERTEYLSGLKGAYNHTDLNRVGEAVKYLKNALLTAHEKIQEYLRDKAVADDYVFKLIKTDISAIKAKTDWTIEDIPLTNEMETYLKNIEILKAALELENEIPLTMNGLTLEDANNIERILFDVNLKMQFLEKEIYSLIDNTILAYEYTNMVYTGG